MMMFSTCRNVVECPSYDSALIDSQARPVPARPPREPGTAARPRASSHCRFPDLHMARDAAGGPARNSFNSVRRQEAAVGPAGGGMSSTEHRELMQRRILSVRRDRNGRRLHQPELGKVRLHFLNTERQAP